MTAPNNSGNLNPVDVSGLLNVPENPNAPTQELPNAQEQPKPESEAGKEQGKEGKDGNEESEEEELVAIDPAFQELRDKMTAAGVDFKDMDAKFAAGEDIGEENIALIAKHSGYKPEEIKSYIKLKQDNVNFLKDSNVRAEEAKQAFLADIDETAGGSYAELQDWVMKNVPQTKVDVWNAALKSPKPETLKAVVQEMQEYRVSKVGAGSGKREKANLDLLTRASNSKSDSSPAQSPVNTLEGNPLANYPLQTLAQIKQIGPAHAQYEDAMKVLRIRAPYMV